MPNANPAALDALIERVEAWREFDFHADYELSDAILLADGWRCEPDAAWEGGVRWSYGTNPTVSTSELSRPRLLLNIGDAMGIIPFGFALQLTTINRERSHAIIWHPRDPGTRWEAHVAPSDCTAVLSAALRAIRNAPTPRHDNAAGGEA